MSEKFKGKYRNESTRLRSWDYANEAAYFITICTKDREHYFGEINDGKLEISPVGSIAYVLWYEIKNHAKGIDLGEFVAMPNHVHGILILTGNDGMAETTVGTTHALSPLPSPLPPSPPPVSLKFPGRPSSLQSSQITGQQRFQNQGKNTVSSIIGSYKSAVTKYCNRIGLSFGWQSLFHDHIIRDYASFERISEYIRTNPANWRDDTFNNR